MLHVRRFLFYLNLTLLIRCFLHILYSEIWNRNKIMIEGIRQKFFENQFEFSQHAVDVSLFRHISVSEIREAISNGDVIEDYPQDKYGPSCLIFGRTNLERPIHIQCSYPSRDLVKVITIYEPDPDFWIDFRKRKAR